MSATPHTPTPKPADNAPLNFRAAAASNVPDLVNKLYGIENWGFGYFFVNDRGNLAVAPSKDRRSSIDIREVIAELTARQQSTPVLLRFPQNSG